MLRGQQRRGSYSFSFTGGSLSSGTTLTRASSGWYFDSSGVLQSAANDVARFTYNPGTLAFGGLLVEPSRTNHVRNPRAEGGAAGSSGTLPTNWQLFGLGTLTRTLSFGTEDGMPYMDLRLNGTTSTTSVALLFEPGTQIAAVTGEDWLSGFNISRPAGSFSNISSAVCGMNEYTSGGAFVAGGNVSFAGASSAALRTQRFTYQRTLSGGVTTAYVAPLAQLFFSSGVVIDITLRFACTQLEKGVGASSIILPPVSSPAATTRAADVLSLALPDGTYSVDITRLSGVTNLTGVAVSGGSYTVPTDVSPLQSVIARRTA